MKAIHHRPQRGFTLVEVLIVITIIIILAAITMVVSRKMIASAKAAQSVENMRQIGAMVLTTAADNNGRLLALREFHGDEPDQPVNWHWNQALASLQNPEVSKKTIANDAAWWWREEPLTLNPQMPKDAFQTYFSGYAMNLFISENDYVRTHPRDWEMILRHETPLAAIREPDRTPLLVPHWNWHTGDLLNGQRLNDIGKSAPFLTDGKLNVVFVDGHAEQIRFATPGGEPLAVSEYAERGLDRMPRF